MTIELAKNAGFCGGVKRAIQMVEDNLDKLPQPIRMYGNLVHNEQVMDRLKEQGVQVVKDLEGISGGSVIFTAHGTSQNNKQRAEQNKARVIDTVCPKVAYMHELIQGLWDKGYRILVYGDGKHPEIKSIPGLDSGSVITFSNEDDVDRIGFQPGFKYALFSQTTNNWKSYKRVCEKLKAKISNIEIFDTICPATYVRQQEAAEMAARNDIMIVAGSLTSANTNRLYQLCRDLNENTFFVQGAGEFDYRRHLHNDIESIGITAGASTPDWVINQIMNQLKQHIQVYDRKT